MAKSKLKSLDIEIRINNYPKGDFLCVTDIAKYNSKEPGQVVRNYFRAKNNIDFLGAWEKMHNENFNYVEFDVIRSEVGSSSFTISAKEWIERTNAIGITATAGRYGGTYAHHDIALQFTTWLSPEFYLYVLKDYQRLKAKEQLRLGDPFNIKRHLTSGNYSLLVTSILSQTDERLLTHPQPYKSRLPFASESDLLNEIVFGKTAKQWSVENPDKPANRNQRDYASVLDLVVLNNLEFLDAMLLQWDCEKQERRDILQEAYDFQYPILKRSKTIKRLQELADAASTDVKL